MALYLHSHTNTRSTHALLQPCHYLRTPLHAHIVRRLVRLLHLNSTHTSPTSIVFLISLITLNTQSCRLDISLSEPKCDLPSSSKPRHFSPRISPIPSQAYQSDIPLHSRTTHNLVSSASIAIRTPSPSPHPHPTGEDKSTVSLQKSGVLRVN